jgi:hypothetical protein
LRTRSAANSGNREGSLCAQRNSIATFRKGRYSGPLRPWRRQA